MTTGNKPAPFRVAVTFKGKRGLVLFNQIRTLDKLRLMKRLSRIGDRTLTAAPLQEMFTK